MADTAAFMCYHAFESTCCALYIKGAKSPSEVSKRVENVGPGGKHPEKIRRARDEARSLGKGLEFNRIRAKLKQFRRNDLLYPTIEPGNLVLKEGMPEERVSLSDAVDLEHSVRDFMKWVDTVLGCP